MPKKKSPWDDAERLDFLRRRFKLKPEAFAELSEMARRAEIPFEDFAASFTMSKEDMEHAAHRASVSAIMGHCFINRLTEGTAPVLLRRWERFAWAAHVEMNYPITIEYLKPHFGLVLDPTDETNGLAEEIFVHSLPDAAARWAESMRRMREVQRPGQGGTDAA